MAPFGLRSPAGAVCGSPGCEPWVSSIAGGSDLIFVSYSQEDRKPFEQLQRFLKPLERARLVDVWDESRLLGGADRTIEIDQALESATVAVLLVSQDFLASDSIYRRELPRIIARAEAAELTLIPVFLGPSLVDDLEIPFTDPGCDEERSVKLTKYHGAGSPSRTLSTLTWSDRDRAFEKLARRLKELEGQPVETHRLRAAAGQATVVEPARSYELTVELVRDGDTLTIRYHLPGREPIATAESSWAEAVARLEPIRRAVERGVSAAVEGLIAGAAAGCGQVLFDVLFGPIERWGEVLRRVFDRPPETPQPNPSFAPVRLRICTAEPLLIGLPWRLAAYGGRLLAGDGWVIATTGAVDPVADVTTTAPSSVLIVAPTITLSPTSGGVGAPADPGHAQAVADLLAQIWPTGREPGYVRIVGTAGQLDNALRGMRPHVLYVYARGELEKSAPSLVLGDSGDRLPLAQLGQMFEKAGHRPEVIYLNVSFPAGRPVPAILPGLAAVPLLVWRCLPEWRPDSTTRAVAWFKRWLGSGIDPVAALHPEADDDLPGVEAATLAIHAAYRTWKTATFRLPSQELKPRLRLDRDKQKALVRKHLAELARSDTRRVMALVAYAAPGNSIAALSEQLRDYLEIEAADLAEINWRRLQLPDVRADLPRDLEYELDLQLKADPKEAVPHLLRRHAPTVTGSGRRAIIWLDWGATGEDRQPPLSARQLGEWLRFSSEYLGTRCPDDLRLVSYLAIESKDSKHKKLARALQAERRQPWNRRREFRISVLPPLGEVPEDELLDFLEDPDNSSCDPAIQPEVAERIIAATGGDFDATIARMEEAEKGSWYDLLSHLRREQGDGPPDDDEVF